jgi:4-amino-4-deoxy-L-arabinose transferase-like glycosyltransferase
MNRLNLVPLLGLLIVYVTGAFTINIMDIDAAQYASIGLEMAQNNNFLEVQHRGIDYYLDKPPLLFWISALMFKLLGATNFAYRLVPILSSLAGIYALFRFTKLYYTELTAYAAALILGSCQAYFLMNHDVRTDTLLTNCVALSIWQLAAFRLNGKWPYLIGGFVWIGLAMLAKGPIGLIVPGAAFFIDIILKRDWKSLFRWEWLAGIGIIALVLLPYCIGLYRQYGTEGIYFFFWKQSFGRITGENSWDNNAPLWFQAQNFLWSFLPWVLLFVAALVSFVRMLIRQKFRLFPTQEALSLGGFVLPFIALSTSHYQLPHYTFVVFPLGAVIAARYVSLLITERPDREVKSVRIALIITSFIMAAIVLILSSWAFPMNNILLILTGLAVLSYVVYLFRDRKSPFSQLVLAPYWTAVGCNFIMNAHVYPTLLTYQSGSELGQELASQAGFPFDKFYMLDVDSGNDYFLFPHALDFYTARTTPLLTRPDEVEASLIQNDTLWLYTDVKGLRMVRDTLQHKTEIVRTLDKYHVTMLTLPFLNPALRPTRTREVYLLKVY